LIQAWKSGRLRLATVLLIVILAAAATVGIVAGAGGAPPDRAAIDPDRLTEGFISWQDDDAIGLDQEPYYADVLREWRSAGLKPASRAFAIDAAKPSAVSDESVFRVGRVDDVDGALIWESTEESWVEYRFTAPEDGLYEIRVAYRPLTGGGWTRPIVWDITLDGVRPYRETSSITLYRLWRDRLPVKVNEDGDQIRPTSEDISTWMTKPLIDSGAAYALPLRWALTAGEHTLRIAGYEPVALKEIAFVPPTEPKPYAEVRAAYPDTGETKGDSVVIQAEIMTSKNDSSIQMFWDRDYRTVPRAKGRITYNTVGGLRWDWPNQEITWEFEVPATGRYKIALRALQDRFSQKASFRAVRIDGEIPFRELVAYRFPYDSDWQSVVLQDEDGEPFEFWLEKGRHTLSLTLTHSTVSPIVRGIENLSFLLQSVRRDLDALTGGQIDRNRTWDIETELPGLTDKLALAAGNLEVLSDAMRLVNGRKDSVSEGFRTAAAADIRALLADPDIIPYYADEITGIEEKINQFVVNLYKQPLLIDEIHIVPADEPLPRLTTSWAEKAAGLALNFWYSFDPRDSLADQDDRVLNVWVFRGRDYVTQLQELADESFTPKTGIKVKVHLLPNTQLLVMSNAANLQPDVALGLPQDLPVDYAIRGSVVNLAEFPDFGELYERYSPGSWLPLYYDGGYYAVPETQSFQVLYYRKDLLRQLGLDVPETWDDVYAMLPVLQQHDKNFYVNPQDFLPYVYQNGAEFFTEDGLRTALDSPEGFRAFRHWTNLFGLYALEREVPSFYQHFRSGAMPVGISDYNLYVQLAAAAPELNGRWGIAPIPGIRREDGTIVRWAGGAQTTGVIFSKSGKKEQAWAFLKWWISAETQERYGSDLESINGVSFRWNTANVEAFVRLPWKKEDMRVILEQWRWYKDKPNPPGGYFLGRELGNAWVRTVVEGMNDRASLEAAILDINRELRRKQLEFGLIDADGRIVRKLHVPTVDKPWEGVDAYVK